MAEETPEQKPDMKFMCVCAFCNEHTSDGVVVEFNFRDQAVYFSCPKCKKLNQLDLSKTKHVPYPRAGMMR